MYKETLSCRFCQKDSLVKILDLGLQPPSDAFRTKEQLKEPTDLYPLELCFCTLCGLHQLSVVVSPEVLYKKDYPYESSITETGKRHYFDFAESVTKKFNLDKDSLVVDIGSNVGVLLEGFKNQGTKVLGVDPAQNIVKIANERGIETICQFFNASVGERVNKTYGKAKLITATNVFAHVEDLYGFMGGIDNLLGENGVFIFESPFFLETLKKLAYDQIYHEHLTYLSLRPVIQFMNKIGFDVFDVEKQDIHTGSVRTFICRKDKRPTEMSVFNYLKEEAEIKLHEFETAKDFAERVKEHSNKLLSVLNNITKKGKSIALLSCPAKSSTLLNYSNIGTQYIDFATEKSKLKIGKFMPMQNIEIFSDEEIKNRKVDVLLLGAWNFAEEIMKNNQDFKGQFLIPLPEPRLV